ncbi:MAG TPA: tetratricopeptide repeat protein [Chloroflexia bacterium]|nr:tetratricopeptide repeat protein [Chloroflexia bacterium]
MLQSDSLLKDMQGYKHNLPAQLNSQVGREREVGAIQAMLRRVDVSLVTLTGPGGVGKTRLAVQVAVGLGDEFAKIYSVNLAPVTEPDRLIPAIAQSTGIKENAAHSILEALQEKLRYQTTLLLLDNFEQLLSGAPLLAKLLAACPGLKLLVTSRAALRLTSEHEFVVAPLDETSAVTLFVQRAQAIRPAFRLTPANTGSVKEICRKLDGLPLAIELAAARIKLLPPPLLLERMEHSLDLLTGGARDLPERQQTLRTTIEWSYDLLTPIQKQLFRRLAIFVSGVNFDIAEKICSSENDTPASFLDNVQSLIEQSLLNQVELDSSAVRLVMLEIIRQFAYEKLEESGESGQLHEALAHYFLALFADSTKSGDEAATYALLDAERDNLRRCLDWAIEYDKVEVALELAGACWQYWWTRGYLNEGRGYLERALALPQSASPAVRARALNALGAIHRLQAAFDKALPCFEESFNLFRQVNDRLGTGITLRWLGMTLKELEKLEESQTYLTESLNLFRELENKFWLAAVMNPLGDLNLAMGDYAQALDLQRESLNLFRELNDERGVAICLANLGTIAFKEQDYQRALDYYRQSIAMLAEINDKNLIVNIALLGCLAGSLGYKNPASPDLPCLTHAARLLGATSAIMADINMAFCLIERRCFDESVREVRLHLGESAFETAFAEGQTFSLEKTVVYSEQVATEISAATSQVPVPVSSGSTGGQNGLTPREVEVLVLVAQGLTNRQIAEKLVLSQLTVASYLHSLYGKLGVTSRAAATRYALENNLNASTPK